MRSLLLLAEILVLHEMAIPLIGYEQDPDVKPKTLETIFSRCSA